MKVTRTAAERWTPDSFAAEIVDRRPDEVFWRGGRLHLVFRREPQVNMKGLYDIGVSLSPEDLEIIAEALSARP